LTADDLTRIETALGISLPDVYRRLVVPFPIPAYAGNTDSALWDDPDALIAFNRELRTGYYSVPPWPEHMFALGRDDGGCANAIDVRDPMGPVWWADRCHLYADGTAPQSPSLTAWAEETLADLRVVLVEHGVDPDGPPEARLRASDEAARAGCRCFLVLLGVGALVVAGTWGIALWLSR
jgi:hypothetical protein